MTSGERVDNRPRMPRASLALLLAAAARAAGVDYPDQGAQAMARGGAFAAKADDLTAIYYNPAGLAKQGGTRFLLHGNFVDQRLSFARAPRLDSGGAVQQRFDEVESTDGIYPVPFVAASSRFGLDRWTFAAGLYGPHTAGNRTFPKCIGVEANDSPDPCGGEEENYAPQRYLLTHQEFITAFGTFGAAYRVARWLDVGAEFQWAYSTVVLEKATNALGSSLPSSDVIIRLGGEDGKMVDRFTPAFMVGAIARPARGVEIGASARPPLTLRHEGEVDLTPSQTLQDSGVAISPDPARATLVMRLPWVVRGGVRYFREEQGFETWDVELDGTYERYSVVDTIDLEFEPSLQVDSEALGASTIEVFRDPNGWSDTWSARLGGGYAFRRVGPGALMLRAGGNYEAPTQPLDYTQLGFTGWKRFGAAAGAAYRWRGVTLSLGYSHLWHETREVTDTRFMTYDTVAGPPAPGQRCRDVEDAIHCTPIGNGTYRASIDLFAVGLDVAFDELLDRSR